MWLANGTYKFQSEKFCAWCRHPNTYSLTNPMTKVRHGRDAKRRGYNILSRLEESMDIFIVSLNNGNRVFDALFSKFIIELEPCARYHCVCLIMTHRLVCNMTYLGHASVQVICPDVRSGFNWPFRVKMYMFWTVLTRGIRRYKIFFTPFSWFESYSRKRWYW